MRHRFHAICPYFAMFPESFVEKHLAASRGDGIVFDPFCGRGTAVFQSLLDGRVAAGCDINPVAFVVSSAKCDAPRHSSVLKRIRSLKEEFQSSKPVGRCDEPEEFFRLCYHKATFAQLLFLRSALNWRYRKTDRFVAALVLGALHGESQKSANYFSNQMPRTISTKPGYSVRWWTARGFTPPARDVFEILETMANFRYASAPPKIRGEVKLVDARLAGERFVHLKGKVTDVITSPPYLDTTNYIEDQWLRLWFLGHAADQQKPRGDHRHTSEKLYWSFLEEVWRGIAPLLAPDCRFVIRIGGRKINKAIARKELSEGVARGTGREIRLLDQGVSSVIKRTQANVFRGAPVSKANEHDFCIQMI